MMMSHTIKPSLVDRSRYYQAPVSGCLRGAMKMASSESNIVSWPRMNETASRDREQNPERCLWRSQKSDADIQAARRQKQRHDQACSRKHDQSLEGFDITLSCRKPARESPCDGSHLAPPKLRPKNGDGLAMLVQPARSTCEASHTT